MRSVFDHASSTSRLAGASSGRVRLVVG